MTNEEILKAMHKRGEAGYGTAMELARADEREKIKNQMLDGVMTDSEFEEYTGSKRDQPQGVDIWVSWDDGHFEFPTVTTKQPKENRMKTFSPNEIGGKYYTDLGQNFTIKKEDAEKLGIKQGECAKFRIVRVGE